MLAGHVLALGLSFGLGGRDTAAKIVDRWYGKASGSSARMASPTEAVAESTALDPRERGRGVGPKRLPAPDRIV